MSGAISVTTGSCTDTSLLPAGGSLLERRPVQPCRGTLALVPPLVDHREAAAKDALLERRGVVQVRERRVRNIDLEELAKRVPALLGVPHQEPLRRDRLLNLAVPALHDLDQAVVALVVARQRAALLPVHAAHELDEPPPLGIDARARVGAVVQDGAAEVDAPAGLAHAAHPGLRIADGQ